MMNGGGGMLASERPKYWRSKLFTTSGTWTVPADVEVIWVDGCGSGGGGGGGNATPGGGGGGGSSGVSFKQEVVPVTPGELITVTIGSFGVGGNAGANGGNGLPCSLVGSLGGVYSQFAGGGSAGANPNGGSGGSPGTNLIGGAGGAGAGGVSLIYGIGGTAVAMNSPGQALSRWSGGSAGGALNFNGGYAFGVNGSYLFLAATTGGSSGGGGGNGGSNPYGLGGVGGSNGAAGSNGGGYGAGGGGGSGNAKGGDGSPGMIRIYCLSSFPI